MPLFGTEKALDANEVLAEVVKAKDLRLWEGFPVVLANAAQKNLFNFDLVKEYLNNPYAKVLFSALLHMSLALYQALDLEFLWAKELYVSLSEKDKEAVRQHLENLKQGKDFKLADHMLSSQRLKTTFSNYFKQEESKLSELASLKEEFSLEYALSQVFSPKQKELFLKKLRGEKMTKTEREYYSRAVRKKVEALASEELHRLAQRAR